jgi:hypothetical protein
VRLKAELLFITLPLIFVGALLFSLADLPKEIGPTVKGKISRCSGGRGRAGGPRICTVDVDSDTSVQVDVPWGQAGNTVLIVKLQKTLSGSTYYAISNHR